MPNPLKAAWEDVEQKAVEELHRVECHQADRVALLVVLPAKGDFALFQRDQSLVGDGHAMRIAGEVLQDMLRRPQGLFGIDHPLGAPEGS
jgi:hypothetical protein